jgi:hypothetical protein
MTTLSVAGTKGARMAAKNHPPTRRRKEEPLVGIFWVINGKPIIDSTSLSEAEDYGDFKTHPRGHMDVWTLFQQRGIATADVEYEEFPRGRVMHNTKTRRFTLLADKCILKDERIISKIMAEMNLLNKNTGKGTDSHYRCFACLRARSD